MKLQIDHVGVWTRDLERLKSFYAEYFGTASGSKYVNESKGFESYFLSFPSGARVEIMSVALLEDPTTTPRSGYAHLALAVGTEAEVDALTERLRAAGVPVVDGPRRTGDGCYERVVLDPDGNRIEITA